MFGTCDPASLIWVVPRVSKNAEIIFSYYIFLWQNENKKPNLHTKFKMIDKCKNLIFNYVTY